MNRYKYSAKLMVESGDSFPGQVPMQRSAICWSPVCGREGLAAGCCWCWCWLLVVFTLFCAFVSGSGETTGAVTGGWRDRYTDTDIEATY